MSLATCLDPQTWAMAQWGTVELGDSLRNERAVAMEAAIAPQTQQAVYHTIPATLGEFWRSVARLGGFLARKSDGQPGWQTLWQRWLRLQDFCWGDDFSLNTP